MDRMHVCDASENSPFLLYSLFSGRYRGAHSVTLSKLKTAYVSGDFSDLLDDLAQNYFGEEAWTYSPLNKEDQPIDPEQVGRSGYFRCLMSKNAIEPNDVIPKWGGNVMLSFPEKAVSDPQVPAELLEAFFEEASAHTDKEIGKVHGVIRMKSDPVSEPDSFERDLLQVMSAISQEGIALKFSEEEDFYPDPRLP
jgi:hypothetical protein